MTQVSFFEQLNITPWSYNSLGSKLMISGNDSISDAATVAYPAANLAIYVPFWVQAPYTIRQVFWANGTPIAGTENIDVGVYDAGKRKIISSGSTLQVNDASTQAVDVADTVIGPGLYFMAIATDSLTQFRSIAMGSLAFYKTLGAYQEASAFSLPTNATFAAPTSDYLPIFGISGRSTAIS
jgi:hypothetical protein